jgi:RNA polymerase sigma-70 factor (ECF subfamily)
MAGPTTDSFAPFYEATYRPVYRYVLLQHGPKDDVEDVVADTFHQAYRAWLAGRGPRDSAMGWILTIARRVLIDHARRQDRRMATTLSEHLPDHAWDQGVREVWIWFEQVSRELPPDAREALVLRYAGGLTADQIGTVLGLSGSGVRSLIGRALATVRPMAEEIG